MQELLNQVDLCFVVDTTGSMGSFIQTAQRQLLDTISLLSADSNIDLQVGLVEYRDHPPQDQTFVTRIYPLNANLKQMQQTIDNLIAAGGGDAPEAVYDGVLDGCIKMNWRSHSCRFILLVGDALPHGFVANSASGDAASSGFTHSDPARYPKGLTVQAVTAAAEQARVTVHALCMVQDRQTVQSFSAIATATGGRCASVNNSQQVLTQIVAMLNAEFRDLTFDHQVLETVQNMGHLDLSQTATILDCSPLQIAGAIARLGKRGFLDF